MTDLTIAVAAPLAGLYGMYLTLEAVASDSSLLGLVGSLISILAGVTMGKLIWWCDHDTE